MDVTNIIHDDEKQGRRTRASRGLFNNTEKQGSNGDKDTDEVVKVGRSLKRKRVIENDDDDDEGEGGDDEGEQGDVSDENNDNYESDKNNDNYESSDNNEYEEDDDNNDSDSSASEQVKTAVIDVKKRNGFSQG